MLINFLFFILFLKNMIKNLEGRGFMYHVRVWCPLRPEEGLDLPELE